MPKRIGHIQNALLCDDIRREEGTNKHILIGVISGDLIIPAFPGAVAPALYVEYVVEVPGTYDIVVEYRSAKRRWTPIKGNMVALAGVATFAFPQALVEVSQPTSLQVFLTVGDDKPIRVVDKKIIAAASPNASLPPSSQSQPDAPAS